MWELEQIGVRNPSELMCWKSLLKFGWSIVVRKQVLVREYLCIRVNFQDPWVIAGVVTEANRLQVDKLHAGV